MEPSGAPWRVLETGEPDPAPAAAEQSATIPWLPIGVAVLGAMVALVTLVLALRPDPGAEIDVPSASGLPGEVSIAVPSPAEPTEIVVDVGGAVARPGVYRLLPGSRIADAIAAAGGYGGRVDAERADRELNLAAVVHDGEQIHVPVRGEVTGSGAGGSGASDTGTGGGATSGPIDVNHASAEELDTLPGIGPVTAAKILAAREERRFASVDELVTRKAVGPATLDKIRELITVGP